MRIDETGAFIYKNAIAERDETKREIFVFALQEILDNEGAVTIQSLNDKVKNVEDRLQSGQTVEDLKPSEPKTAVKSGMKE